VHSSLELRWLQRAGARHPTRGPAWVRLGSALRCGPAEQRQPPNDGCQSAVLVAEGAWYGDTSEATNDGQASCGASLFSPDVWFRYQATASGVVWANTFGSSFDTVLSVHSACPGTLANELECNDDSWGLQSQVGFTTSAGNQYLIRVSGFNSATGAYVLNFGSGGAIQGMVTDAMTGDPLPCGTVRAFDQDGAQVATGYLDSAGTYTISGPRLAATFGTTLTGIHRRVLRRHPVPGRGGLACDPTTGTLLPLLLGATTAKHSRLPWWRHRR
jgi:hypothetical protein